MIKKINTKFGQISNIGLGGNIFGYSCDEKASHDIMSVAQEVGINFIDTANVYSHGSSEKIIGNFIHNDRDRWIVATKVGIHSDETSSALGAKCNILYQVDESLKRLKTDYIDLYQIHHYDPDTPIYETLEAFDLLVQRGKIKAFGVSNFSSIALKKCIEISSVAFSTTVASTQCHYNLLCRDNETWFKDAKENDVAILAYGALARGVLTDKYISNAATQNSRASLSAKVASDLTPEVIQVTRELSEVARSVNLNLSQAAAMWAVRPSGCDASIIGISNYQQLKDFSQLPDIFLDHKIYANLEALAGTLTGQYSFGTPKIFG